MQLKRYYGPDYYFRKLLFYRKEQLFYCYKKLREKKDLMGRLSLLGSLRRIATDKTFQQRTVELSFFYGVGSDRILGNDKGVGEVVFTKRKIKTYKR